MFAKLLNVVRRWFSVLRKPDQPRPGPPAHWLKLRNPGPPEHWLESARRAGPMERMVVADEPENPTARTWPARPETANEDASPKPAGLQRIFAYADAPRTGARDLESSFFEDRVQEILQKSDDSSRSAIARIFRRKGSKAKAAAPVTAPASDQELPTAKPVPPRPERPSKSANETKWPRWSRKTPLTPSTFSTERGKQYSPASFRDSARVGSFPSLKIRNGDTPTGDTPKRDTPGRESSTDRRLAPPNFEAAEASSRSLSRSPATTEGWTGNPELHPDPPPNLWPALPESDRPTSATSWPELPDSEEFAASAFFSPSASQPVASRFSASLPNSWPSLAPDPVTTDFNPRSLLRSLQRSQRLEKEQRGY